MEKVKGFELITMTLTFLALVPMRESNILSPPPEPRPLCATQFSLVNYACSSLPIVQRPPDFPKHSDDEEHGHHDRHQRRHHRHSNPQEENCCRWAKDVDSQCVCELLLHFRLPIFLMRPSHQYTLTIGESCEVTYSCGGPV